MPYYDTRVEKPCRHCGGIFLVRAKVAGDSHYCSKQCMIAFEREYGRESRVVAPAEFACKQCGKPFHMKPGFLTQYRKKYGRDPLYCSRECSGKGRRGDNEARQTFVCEHCGKEEPRRKYDAVGRVKYYTEQRFCSQACKVAAQMAKAAERFNAGVVGRHVKRNGYIWISIPGNVSGTGKKREMLEHRWAMEKSLGRTLIAGETVHHINGDRSDNRIENLELFSDRHGPGQRVIDKISFAIEILNLYPEFAAAAGYVLAKLHKD